MYLKIIKMKGFFSDSLGQNRGCTSYTAKYGHCREDAVCEMLGPCDGWRAAPATTTGGFHTPACFLPASSFLSWRPPRCTNWEKPAGGPTAQGRRHCLPPSLLEFDQFPSRKDVAGEGWVSPAHRLGQPGAQCVALKPGCPQALRCVLHDLLHCFPSRQMAL